MATTVCMVYPGMATEASICQTTVSIARSAASRFTSLEVTTGKSCITPITQDVPSAHLIHLTGRAQFSEYQYMSTSTITQSATVYCFWQ